MADFDKIILNGTTYPNDLTVEGLKQYTEVSNLYSVRHRMSIDMLYHSGYNSNDFYIYVLSFDGSNTLFGFRVMQNQILPQEVCGNTNVIDIERIDPHIIEFTLINYSGSSYSVYYSNNLYTSYSQNNDWDSLDKGEYHIYSVSNKSAQSAKQELVNINEAFNREEYINFSDVRPLSNGNVVAEATKYTPSGEKKYWKTLMTINPDDFTYRQSGGLTFNKKYTDAQTILSKLSKDITVNDDNAGTPVTTTEIISKPIVLIKFADYISSNTFIMYDVSYSTASSGGETVTGMMQIDIMSHGGNLEVRGFYDIGGESGEIQGKPGSYAIIYLSKTWYNASITLSESTNGIVEALYVVDGNSHYTISFDEWQSDVMSHIYGSDTKEEVTSRALNDLNARVSDLEQGGGGSGITGITMNGSAVTVTSGVANLGTVITDKSDKQDTLVSGTNIKTINNQSILGAGNITISGGSSYTAGEGIDITSDVITNTREQRVLTFEDSTTGVKAALRVISPHWDENSIETVSDPANDLTFVNNVPAANADPYVQANYLDGTLMEFEITEYSESSSSSFEFAPDSVTGGVLYVCVDGEWVYEGYGSIYAKDSFDVGQKFRMNSTMLTALMSAMQADCPYEIMEVEYKTYAWDTNKSVSGVHSGKSYPLAYNSDLTALAARVTALETALGNISSSLDTINGEVI